MSDIQITPAPQRDPWEIRDRTWTRYTRAVREAKQTDDPEEQRRLDLEIRWCLEVLIEAGAFPAATEEDPEDGD